MRFGKEGFDKPRFCKAGKIRAKIYRYDLGIMGIMPVTGGCLTKTKTQECLAVLP